MRFQGKYDLLEQLTSGAVDSFEARRIGGSEKLLVYIFSCLRKIEPASSDALLQEFALLAPKPSGELIDFGVYDGGSGAFLVTKPPDPAALRNWIDNYQSTAKKRPEPAVTAADAPTQAIEIPAEWIAAASAKATAVKPMGDFTKAFAGSGDGTGHTARFASSALRFEARDTKSPAPVAKLEPAEKPSPSFTEQFFASVTQPSEARRPSEQVQPREAALDSAIEEDLSQLKRKNDNRVPIGGTPKPKTESFDLPSNWTGAALKPQVPSATVASREPRGTGEFTKFFNGPFDAAAENRDAPLPEIVEPAKPAEGSFTRTFGRDLQGDEIGQNAAAGSSSSQTPSPWLEPGGFTRAFEQPLETQNPPSAMRNVKTPDEPVLNTGTFRPNVVPMPAPAFDSTKLDAGLRTPEADRVLDFPALSGEQSGATRLFRPGRDLTVEPPPLPAGESEYTQVVNRGALQASLRDAAAAKAGSSSGTFPNPAVAGPPVVTPPQPPMAIPQAPAATPPTVPWPQPPAPTAPPAPAWSSYLPLIVVLNLLLIAAVGLVLYFALKH